MPIDAMSTAAAAKILGVAPSTVTRACVKHGIGTLISPRLRALTPEDVEQLRSLVSNQKGNPNFGQPGAAEKGSAARWKAKPKKRPAKKPSRKPKSSS